MADRTIEFVIRSLYDNAGAKKSLGDLRILVEAANRGSKEAADALDLWRRGYGKLSEAARAARGEIALTNTGAGLATLPSLGGGAVPPIIPPSSPGAPANAGGGAGGAGLGTARQLLGRAGLGGIATGAAAIGTAVGAATRAIRDWLAALEEMVDRSRSIDNVSQRIDSLAAKTRALAQHNKEFEQSYNQISRQVKTTALEIQHLTEIQNTQLEFQRRLADAQMEAALADNALRNRLNPVARIQEEGKIREDFLARQMEQEAALEKVRMDMHQKEMERASEREAKYTKQAEALRSTLPALELQADQAAETAKAVASAEDQKITAIEKERKIVQEMSLGKFDAVTLARYNMLRMGSASDLVPGSDASTALQGAVTFEMGTLAGGQRLKELDSQLEEAKLSKMRAKMSAIDAQGTLSRRQKMLGIAEDESLSSQTEVQKAAEALQQEESLRAIRQRGRESILPTQQKAVQSGTDLQILNEFLKNNSVGPTGGGASVDPDMQRNNELLDRIARALEA